MCFARPDIIHRHRAEDHAVVKQHDDRADAPRHAQREREDGNFRVVRHQLGRKTGLVPLQPVFCCIFLLGHTLGRVLQQMENGISTGLASGSNAMRQSAKRAAGDGDRHRKIKSADVPAKGLRPGLEKTISRGKKRRCFSRVSWISP